MKKAKIMKLIESYAVAAIGGVIFYLLNLPLPWILGPMAMMIIWKSLTKRELTSLPLLYNVGLVLLGIYFGLSFTKSTFTTVTPFILPFIIATAILVVISIISSNFITKFIKVDSKTSILGSIPGGLNEMVATSTSLNANTSLVIVFQTVRLLTVVFLVPFIVVHLFTAQSPIMSETVISHTSNGELFNLVWYVLAFFVAKLFKNIIPASFVIVPLLITAILNIIGVGLPVLPDVILILAQLAVGTFMGTRITLNDLKLGGKYSGLYFIMTLLLVGVSFGMGYLFTIFTDLSLATSILSFSPGGLVEMVLTAEIVGADPAIVSSLQFLRILFIIGIVPSTLKWYFTKKAKKMVHTSND